jgi:hypothetical protein
VWTQTCAMMRNTGHYVRIPCRRPRRRRGAATRASAPDALTPTRVARSWPDAGIKGVCVARPSCRIQGTATRFQVCPPSKVIASTPG